MKRPGIAGGKRRAKQRTTKQRGYGGDWRRFRVHQVKAQGAYCQRCWELHGTINEGGSKPLELHHIESIATAPHKRLKVSNVRLLCWQWRYS